MLDVTALALACGLAGDHGLLEAIVRVESAGNPNALAVNGEVELVREPRSREEAVAMARWLMGHGYNFDAGLAQVNSANLARLGLDAASVFEPCANLRAGTRVLGECLERALAQFGRGDEAITAALSCYNTGHFIRGVTNGYVAAVRANASHPLVLHSREPAISRGAGARGRWREGARGEVRAPVRAAPTAPATRIPDAFARDVADAFGSMRAAGDEELP